MGARDVLDDPVLVDDWHPVALARDLTREPGKPIGVRLLDEDVVIWHVNSQPLAWQDLCVHRGTRLSLGDRAAIAYRRWLRQLGLSVGTA